MKMTVNKKQYPIYGDSVVSKQLANGLRVMVVAKPEYYKTYATLSVEYGSIDNQFIDPETNQLVTLPAGIAHFLEHKMFDKNGYDAFDLFTKYGSNANAYTSFTNTNYLFSTTNHVNENLKILLDFVQEPYFTPEKVEKEKGIIGQEIQMYDDDPDSRLYFQTIRNLYPHFPLNKDIAGSVDSIQKITAADLNLAYRVFYQPANMVLKVVGNVNPDEVFSFVEENQNQKQFATPVKIERRFPSQRPYDFERDHHETMNLARPKAAVAIKGIQPLASGVAETKQEMAMLLLLALLFSENSQVYSELYDSGVLDDSFTFELDCEREYYFAMLLGDTDEPQRFIDSLISVMRTAVDKIDGLTADFELIKKEKIGQRVSMMNSLEAIATRLGDKENHFTNLYDEVAIIDQMQLSDLKAAAVQLFDLKAVTTNIFD
ncbi:EF-P 5-aminopentanol modification-associated protein YfmH [Lactobacillus sp. Sy-1]|uniref:EF-P 5-aminopentanol modification-associated protein YfmH n=1 Tax=Lactobacillus sp. Sy-1 TaxID=2109645 RepID=UPI001C5811CF|nr:pitrilysin family protein [Lactobacillus sp. Sy-1]MBW1605799.1 insulinase family protein [Lactobacillus sp. Sy-1]